MNTINQRECNRNTNSVDSLAGNVDSTNSSSTIFHSTNYESLEDLISGEQLHNLLSDQIEPTPGLLSNDHTATHQITDAGQSVNTNLHKTNTSLDLRSSYIQQPAKHNARGRKRGRELKTKYHISLVPSNDTTDREIMIDQPDANPHLRSTLRTSSTSSISVLRSHTAKSSNKGSKTRNKLNPNVFEERLIKAFQVSRSETEAISLSTPEDILSVLRGPAIIPSGIITGAHLEADLLTELYRNRPWELKAQIDRAKAIRQHNTGSCHTIYKALISSDHYKREHKLGRQRSAEAAYWLFMISFLKETDVNIESTLLSKEQFESKYQNLINHPHLKKFGNIQLQQDRLFHACNTCRLLFQIITPVNNTLLALLVLSCSERSGNRYQRSGHKKQTFSTSCRRYIIETEGCLDLSAASKELLDQTKSDS